MNLLDDEYLMKMLMNQRKKNFSPFIKIACLLSYNILKITRFRSIKCLKSFKKESTIIIELK